jgi:hypothetical protein
MRFTHGCLAALHYFNPAVNTSSHYPKALVYFDQCTTWRGSIMISNRILAAFGAVSLLAVGLAPSIAQAQSYTVSVAPGGWTTTQQPAKEFTPAPGITLADMQPKGVRAPDRQLAANPTIVAQNERSVCGRITATAR